MSAPTEKERKTATAGAESAPPKTDPRAKLHQPERKPLILAPSPHAFTTASVSGIMWSVVAALAPAALMAVYFFREQAVIMIVACTAAAVGTEALLNRLRGRPQTVQDGSAALTGLLLALTLPPSLPVAEGVLGAAFAIALGKQIFGGLGYNIFNPALLGRAFLQASFPVDMTTWVPPHTAKFSQLDAVTAATPLGQFKFERILTDYQDLFFGNIGGSLGETSALALLAGGLYLLIRKHADWRIPVSYLGTVVLVSGCFWLLAPDRHPDPLFHLLAGGLMLGAFFMATDPVTSPFTPLGAWIFGAGAGVLLVVIRVFGGLPEGVMYSILLMNAVTPLLNRYTRPRVFGEAPA